MNRANAFKEYLYLLGNHVRMESAETFNDFPDMMSQ